MCYPLSSAALGSTQPSLCACGSPVRIPLVPLRPDPPTRKLSAPAHYPRTWSCLCLHWGRREAADSPCSCTARSWDCRARSTLHVGDRYPVASRRSWCPTSSRMSVPRPLLFSPLFYLKWLSMLLMIVQLLSTSVHVVNPW